MDIRELRLFDFTKTGTLVIFPPFPSSSVNQEYPTLTTFFAGEIISRKRPFLTRKWDADEDVDRKHWVCMDVWPLSVAAFYINVFPRVLFWFAAAVLEKSQPSCAKSALCTIDF